MELASTGSDQGRLPDWLIIGAMKAATTSLHRYLAEHPDIATSTPKELNFFTEPRYSNLGIEWYRQQFNNRPGATVAGESSVNYTKCVEHPGVAERIHRHLPDAKLIYVLRDPIKRIESHWVHEVGAGRWRGDFHSAVVDPDSSPMVQASCYATQLEQYLRHFDPAQVKILSYDSLSRDPQGTVEAVLEFLGLDPHFEHPLIGKKIHRSDRKMRPNRLGLLLWEDPARRRRVRKYLRRVAGTPIEKPTWNPDDLAVVTDRLRPEVDKIRDFSGLEFSDWLL